MVERFVRGIGGMASHFECWQWAEVMIECLMPELHPSLMLAVSRIGGALLLLLVASFLMYLAIKGLRTGKVRGRDGIYTKEENSVMFSILISFYFILAVMMFLGLLSAVFAP